MIFLKGGPFMAKKLPTLSLTIQGYGTNGEGVARLPDGMACVCQRHCPSERLLPQLTTAICTLLHGHSEASILFPVRGNIRTQPPSRWLQTGA